MHLPRMEIEAVIKPHGLREATLEPWDLRALALAARVAVRVEAVLPGARVEHVSSAAVAGLRGHAVLW